MRKVLFPIPHLVKREFFRKCACYFQDVAMMLHTAGET